jgi:6-pyruvoyltetrahydropterin/6-carboxytetrahydropterin synthase
MYYSTKRFSGYSTCFRQWRATHSHCRFLHGYAMEFKVTFQGTLDDRNWVMDFGAFKRNGIKEHLSHMFDHTTVVASDDPELEHFKSLEEQGLIQLRIIEHVGCEKFAEYVYYAIQGRLKDTSASVLRVECFENGKNSAIFELSESNGSSL